MIIKLKDLLFESAAGEEAKKLGLVHKGYGNYADSSGTVTHRSEKGQLVPVGSKEKPAEKSGLGGPSGIDRHTLPKPSNSLVELP